LFGGASDIMVYPLILADIKLPWDMLTFGKLRQHSKIRHA